MIQNPRWELDRVLPCSHCGNELPLYQLQWVSVAVSGRRLRQWLSCAACLPVLTAELDTHAPDPNQAHEAEAATA